MTGTFIRFRWGVSWRATISSGKLQTLESFFIIFYDIYFVSIVTGTKTYKNHTIQYYLFLFLIKSHESIRSGMDCNKFLSAIVRRCCSIIPCIKKLARVTPRSPAPRKKGPSIEWNQVHCSPIGKSSPVKNFRVGDSTLLPVQTKPFSSFKNSSSNSKKRGFF